jgi:hypothetical protein
MDGERPPLDVWRLLAVLRDCGAAFVVVGSAAGWAHGAGRRPADLDCVAARNAENFEPLTDALRRLRARPNLRGLITDDTPLTTHVDATLLAAMSISTWITDAGELDLLDAISGPDSTSRYYEDLAPRSVPRRFGPVSAPVAALDDLIDAKRAADRGPIDRTDLDDLCHLRAAQTGRPARRAPAMGRGLDVASEF